jgi:hypothetical protein
MSTRVSLALGLLSLFAVACGTSEEAAPVEEAATPEVVEEAVVEEAAPEEVVAEDVATEEATTEEAATEEVAADPAASSDAAALPGNNSNPMEGVEAGHGGDRLRVPTNVNRMSGGGLQNQNQGE